MSSGFEPAFPGETRNQYFTGMTLRDYFAGQALMGLCAHVVGAKRKDGETPSQADARVAYERADDMILESERKRT